METIGFIGTGVMGRSMAGHLLAAGHRLLVFNRSREKAQSLVDKGAVWCETVPTLAADADVVITMVGYPSDVESVYLGPGGVLENLRRGGLAIDMTTSSPALARQIAEVAAKCGIHVLDAPVSGGDIGAREAFLSIMVGGQADVFARALPIFQRMGKTVVLQGPAGAGQLTKLCNQICIAANMMGVCESLVFAKRNGLDPATVLQSIESGAAGSVALSKLAPRMLKGDFAPGFYVKHFIKDMNLALDAAKTAGLTMPGLAQAEMLYQRLSAQGGADDGTQALFRMYLENRHVDLA